MSSPDDKNPLDHLIGQLLERTITDADFETLQQAMKRDADLRASYRQRMDMEAALHTWAADAQPADLAPEDFSTIATPSPENETADALTSRKAWAAAALAATLLLVISGYFVRSIFSDSTNQPIATEGFIPKLTPVSLGTITTPASSVWSKRPNTRSDNRSDRLVAGTYALTSGVADMELGSGVRITVEAPAEIKIESTESADLISGTVFVAVDESATEFVLKTPESRVSERGTEYVVSVSEDNCEVHVFDGAVVWESETELVSALASDPISSTTERIEAGRAMRFDRGTSSGGRFIPFGIRRDAQQAEAEIKRAAGDALVAFDGFEYMAGRIRRGRSGFGWRDPWQPAGGRRRWGTATVVPASPGHTGFEHTSNQRQLAISENDNLRRTLDQPMTVSAGSPVFISMSIAATGNTQSTDADTLTVTWEPVPPARRRIRPIVECTLSRSLLHSQTTAPQLCVLTFRPEQDEFIPVLRNFGNRDAPTFTLSAWNRSDLDATPADSIENDSWTPVGPAVTSLRDLHSVRLSVTGPTTWLIDDLKIGTTLESVLPPVQTERSDFR